MSSIAGATTILASSDRLRLHRTLRQHPQRGGILLEGPAIPPAKLGRILLGGHFQNGYHTVCSAIGSEALFPDSCACTDFLRPQRRYQLAIFSIPAGASANYSHVTSIFSSGAWHGSSSRSWQPTRQRWNNVHAIDNAGNITYDRLQ